MSAALTIENQVPALVTRARAGDENAMALLAKVGETARRGISARAQAAYAAIKRYIDTHPAEGFSLGDSTPIIAGGPAELLPPKQIDFEARKPVLPRGAFDQLFDPDVFALVVLRACNFRHGLNAAAVILATGPALTKDAVQGIGMSTFGSDESTGTFYYGVKFSGEQQWRAVGPHLAPELRRCMAIGQCVGRARKLQMLRAGGPVSAYSQVAGWELGE